MLLARVLLLLVYCDVLSLFGFRHVHQWIRRTRVASSAGRSLESLCRAADLGCALYVKRVMCLQRAAVTTSLLRTFGIRAELVIGHRAVPLDSHAWVEVNDEVVNDRPQYKKFFMVLDRL